MFARFDHAGANVGVWEISSSYLDSASVRSPASAARRARENVCDDFPEALVLRREISRSCFLWAAVVLLGVGLSGRGVSVWESVCVGSAWVGERFMCGVGDTFVWRSVRASAVAASVGFIWRSADAGLGGVCAHVGAWGYRWGVGGG